MNEAKARRSVVRWEDMIGKTDFDFLPLEEAKKCRDRTKSWISVSKFPWKDSRGENIGVVGISRYISKRKKLENHIQHMLSIATHDMRSPIVSFALTIKLLAKGRFGEVSGSVKQTLSYVFNRLMRLKKIVEEYLTKSSVMSCGEIGKKELLDLREDIIDPILGEFSQEIMKKDIQIDNRLGGIPGDKIIVSANKNWLAIVYRNLLSNAINYTQKGGVIAYDFEDSGKMYRLNVYNSGKPIPVEKRSSIFEMFESEGSSGIGLPVSRELVRRHGGDLWCEESPDGHPNFIFSLPKE